MTFLDWALRVRHVSASHALGRLLASFACASRGHSHASWVPAGSCVPTLVLLHVSIIDRAFLVIECVLLHAVHFRDGTASQLEVKANLLTNGLLFHFVLIEHVLNLSKDLVSERHHIVVARRLAGPLRRTLFVLSTRLQLIARVVPRSEILLVFGCS